VLIPKYRQKVVDEGSRSLYKNVMFCTFFRLRNSQAKACGYQEEICNVGVNQLPSYRFIPAILAGIHVFMILCFSGSKKHLSFI
jgi:hypothetical protein